MAKSGVRERGGGRFSRVPSPNQDPDAGSRGLGHYERRLPAWRFKLRQRIIPILRAETPVLAWLQDTFRSPVLESYFAYTANLGTHTFFMAALPICFWCGYPDTGVAMIQMLAMGVYLSGVAKDLVCLPRPLSPPLQRISMSKSAAMEYGFPSTHATNAMSVTIFCLYHLHVAREDYSDLSYYMLSSGCYVYAISIIVGRLYCGMHGFSDVAVGSLIGAIIGWIRIAYGTAFDSWIITGSWIRPAMVAVAMMAAIRINPEPADNCPCFDDSVAFCGVVIGSEIGIWHYASRFAGSAIPLASFYPFDNASVLKSLVRVIGGIIVIFMWRAVMKPLLLRSLPPVFRFVDSWGHKVTQPRRYYLQSSDYQTVPSLQSDDNVIPPASELSTIFTTLNTQRKRAVSVGPLSEADAREHIAYRDQRRRDSKPGTGARTKSAPKPRPAVTDLPSPVADDEAVELTPSKSNLDQAQEQLSRQFLQVDGANTNILTPPLSDAGASSDSGREDEKNDREMFSSLEKPRVRYDVEVITKLVVYAGIGWLADEGCPLLFELVGLA